MRRCTRHQPSGWDTESVSSAVDSILSHCQFNCTFVLITALYNGSIIRHTCNDNISKLSKITNRCEQHKLLQYFVHDSDVRFLRPDRGICQIGRKGRPTKMIGRELSCPPPTTKRWPPPLFYMPSMYVM